MEIPIQILVTGLTMGSMYALAAVGLSLIFGTLGMFNMAHGMFMTAGAYIVYAVASTLSIPMGVAVIAAMLAGALVGIATHLLMVRFMLSSDDFSTNIIVATAGLAILMEDITLKIFGGYPYPQAVGIKGNFGIGGVTISNQSLVILLVAMICIGSVAWLLLKTKFGRAIRATAMNQDAARLMGVRTNTVYLQVMALAGALAGVAGLMISTIATLSPQMGGDPLLKAFVICVVAGLGNVWGAGVCALGLALIEATIGFYFGVRFGFPAMLLLVIIVLIWRPQGLFGKEKVVRL